MSVQITRQATILLAERELIVNLEGTMTENTAAPGKLEAKVVIY